MGDERLTFSVSGLTIRGFHWHSDEWVPEPGQRLPCSLSGPIDILKDGKSVGHICKEAPNKFKDWLKKAAEMDAVVENYPKSHRGRKGIEVPAIFIFSGEKNSLMINIMKAIKADENHLDFSIEGMTVRGFDTYMKYWVPEIGHRFPCSVSETGSVQLLNEGQTIGNVQHEGQRLFKMFVNADGVITAVVNGDPKKHRTKGEEVPVTFEFTGIWTKKLKNIRNQISEDIKKKSKKKKSLKFIPGDITEKKKDLDNQLDGVAGTSGESGKKPIVLQEQKDTSKQQQSKEKAQGSGEIKVKAKASTSSEPMTSTKSTRKRRSDGSLETPPKKVASTGQMQRAEENGASGDGQRNSTVGSKIWFSSVANVTKQTSGEFINTTGRIETVQEAKAKVAASGSVCKIVYPTNGGCGTGTGFRVGPRYIMTAAHVSDAFPKEKQYAKEVYAIFNYIKDGDCSKENIYYFKEVVYSDANTDIAVIELEEHPSRMPQAFLQFCPPVFGRGFFLIGHSKGDIMQIDTVVETIDRDTPEAKNTLRQLQSLSMEHTRRPYDTPPHNTPDNPDRILFHCKFTKGASGSPGVVHIGDSVYVTTMLLHGYPDWYYDPTMECFKNSWQQEACVEQGVNMQSVHRSMSVTHHNLSREIFGIDPKW